MFDGPFELLSSMWFEVNLKKVYFTHKFILHEDRCWLLMIWIVLVLRMPQPFEPTWPNRCPWRRASVRRQRWPFLGWWRIKRLYYLSAYIMWFIVYLCLYIYFYLFESHNFVQQATRSKNLHWTYTKLLIHVRQGKSIELYIKVSTHEN